MPVDVTQLEYTKNLTDELLMKIKSSLGNESRQIKKNKYLLSFSTFIKLLALMSNINGLYCTSYDRSLHELEGLYKAEMKVSASRNAKSSKQQLYLITSDDRTIYVDNKGYWFNLFGRAFVFIDNRLYLLNKSIDVHGLKEINASKKKTLSESDLAQILNEKVELKNFENDIVEVQPVPILYVTFDSTSISGELFFSYNGYEVPCNSSEERLRDAQNNVIYLRSLTDERYALNILKHTGWKQVSANVFLLNKGISVERSFNKLLKNNFEVLTLDRKKISSANSINYTISYRADWFELTANSMGKDSSGLTHLINLKSRKRYIELDDKVILLPDLIWDHRRIFKQNGGEIKADKKYIGQIFEILEQPSVSSTLNPDKLINLESIKLVLPCSLQKTLRSYQKDGIRWLLYLYKNNLGGCLADDMGLGKTIQAIAFIRMLAMQENEKLHVLVVVPKTLIENWVQEFNRFGEEITVSIYHGENRVGAIKEFIQTGGVLLTTFHTLLNDIEFLNTQFFHCMFIDEAQYIKNYKAKTYAAAKKINARSKFALSGTPLENNIGELWALMDLINQGTMGSRAEFMKKYADLSTDKYIMKRLNARIKPFILRRLKKDVLKELPEKNELNILCDMEDTQRTLYNSILLSIKNELERMPDRFEIKDSSIILEGLLYLRQVCCHPALLRSALNWNHSNESGKFELFKLKVDELWANQEKVVVFSQFTSMLGIMRKWAEKKGYNTFYLDGSTRKRQEVVDRFEDSNDGIFFISLKAGGTGLNIVSCQYVIIYDPWWNPAVENQAADRIYRIGQRKNVFVYHLVTVDSIEEKIEKLKSKKREIADNLLIDTGQPDKLTIKELKSLILE